MWNCWPLRTVITSEHNGTTAPHRITPPHRTTITTQVKLESKSKFKQALEEEISRFRALNAGLGPGINEEMIEEQWIEAGSNELEPSTAAGMTEEQWTEARWNEFENAQAGGTGSGNV